MIDSEEKTSFRKKIETLKSSSEQLRAAEKRARLKAARLEELIDTLPVGLAECDTAGAITFANATLEKMTGYPRKQLIGRRVWELMPSGAQRDAMPEYLDFIRTDRPACTSCIIRQLGRDGAISDIQVEWCYRTGKGGELAGYTAIFEDIGDRLRADEALHSARKELESRLRERTRALLEAYRLLGFMAGSQ